MWFSVIIRPRIPAEQVPLLQFLFANALRRAIERVFGVHLEVKWPNDLVVNWKKLAGILIETKISGSKVGYVIVGIGLNVNLTAKDLPIGATSIFMASKKHFSLEKTMSSVLTALEGHYNAIEDKKSVLSDWWNHCAHRMKPVIIETGNGLVRGKCVGVNLDGSIIVKTDKGNVVVTDGTLRSDV